MSKYLPPYPSLESLHNQAKQLLKGYRGGSASARRRIQSLHPRFSPGSPPEVSVRLADAQLVIAREYGFDSWPKLKRRVEALCALSTAVSVGDAGDIDAAWLSRRLHQRGYLPTGRVEAIERQDIQSSKEGVQRLYVSYSPEAPPGLPASFIYKYNTKGRNRPHPSGTREFFFYQVLVPQMPLFPVAACFDMGVNQAAGQSYLLLEDLELTHYSPPATDQSPYGGWLSFQEVGLDQFELVARQLARFQARWWDRRIIGRPPLIESAPGLGSLNDAGRPEAVAGIVTNVEAMAQELQPEVVSAVARAAEKFPDLYRARLERGRNLTLIHVDFHLRSVFLPNDRHRHEVMIIDWETVQRSVGVADIAYLVISSMLPTSLRRQCETRLLAAYHEELVAGGVRGYSLDDCQADFRLALVGLPGIAAPPFIRAWMSVWRDWGGEQLLGRG